MQSPDTCCDFAYPRGVSRPYLLLIEDNLADAELTRAATLHLSVEIEFGHAFGGDEGFSLLTQALERDRPPSRALVLLDLGLPGVDGLEVLRRFKEDPTTSAIPVVVFSGSEDQVRVRNSLSAHANAYVHKADDVDCYVRRVCHISETFLVHASAVGG